MKGVCLATGAVLVAKAMGKCGNNYQVGTMMVAMGMVVMVAMTICQCCCGDMSRLLW